MAGCHQLKLNCMQSQVAAMECKQIARYDPGSREALSRSCTIDPAAALYHGHMPFCPFI